MPVSPAPAPLPDRPASKRTTVLFLTVIIALGMVVSYNWILSIQRQHNVDSPRLPMQGRVETDPLPVWLDQDGRERHLEELRGKVFVVSYLDTQCTQGCVKTAEELVKLHTEFGANPNFAILSIPLHAEQDRPAVIKAWMDSRSQSGHQNWLFLTSPGGEGEAIRNWMKKTFRIFAKQSTGLASGATTPGAEYSHEHVLALVDSRGNIRTPTQDVIHYRPFHEAFDYQMFPRPIRVDILKLLDEINNPS